MAEGFDPYHKWLGILPKDQPPHHYRLLSLELFEDDVEVIERAAERQLSFLRKYQSGTHAAECNKLLNQVAKARLCLLKAKTKAEYDAELQAKLEESSADLDPDEESSESENSGHKLLLPLIGGGIVLVGIIVALVMLRGGGKVDPKAPAGKSGPDEVAQAASNGAGSVGKPGDAKPTPDKEPANGSRQIDLLPLVTAKQILKGQWKTDPKVLEALGSQLQGQIAIPIDVPPEYTVHVEATRLATPGPPYDTFGVGLVCGPGVCMYAICSGISGLQLVDEKHWQNNETSIPLSSPVVDKPFQIDAIVRKNNVEVHLDGRTVVDWHGDFLRLKRQEHWNAAPANQLFLGAETGYRITKLTLGPPLPRAKLPRSEAKPNESVDLASLVDLKRDLWRGNWSKDGTNLVSDSTQPDAKFQIPFELPAEYELTIDVEPQSARKQFYLGLPIQQGFAGILLGGNSDRAGLYLEQDAHYEGDSPDGLPHIQQQFPEFGKGRQIVVVTVRQNQIVVKVGDRVLFDWKGDPRRFAKLASWGTPGQYLTVGSDSSAIRLHSVKLKSLPPSAGALAPAGMPSGGDLLSIVDATRDTIQGGWSQSTGKVVSEDKKASAIRFPASLPANYELRAVVERKAGGDNLSISLPVAGKSVMVGLDFGNGSAAGIELMEGKRGHENSTTIRQAGHRLPVGRPCVLQARVEGKHLRFDVNGEKLWDLDIPDDLLQPVVQFRPGWLTAEERLQIGIGTWFSVFEIRELRFRPLDAASPQFPPLDAAVVAAASAPPPGAAPAIGQSRPPKNPTQSGQTMSPGGRPGRPRYNKTPRATGGLLNFENTALTAAEENIRNNHGQAIKAAKSDSQLISLAEKFEKLADDNKTDLPVSYAYLNNALGLWASAGKLPEARSVITRMVPLRWRDPSDRAIVGLTSSMLSRIPRDKDPQLNRDVIRAWLALVDRDVAEQEYTRAIGTLWEIGEAFKRFKDAPLQSEFNEVRKEVQLLEKEISAGRKAVSRLESKPNDPGDSLTGGRWLCLRQNDWDQGVKLLTKVKDAKLKELAGRDVAQRDPANAAKPGALQLGKDWLAFADARKDHYNAGFAERALYWMKQAELEPNADVKGEIASVVYQALQVRDWDLSLGRVLSEVSRKVASVEYTRVPPVGPAVGTAFEDLDPKLSRILTGFDYTVKENTNVEADGPYAIRALRPIYATERGLVQGAWHGTPGDAEPTTVMAPRGYAISGISVHAGPGIEVMQFKFSKMGESGLDPTRTVESTVHAQLRPNMVLSKVTPSDKPIIGIHGTADDSLRSLGVIVTK